MAAPCKGHRHRDTGYQGTQGTTGHRQHRLAIMDKEVTVCSHLAKISFSKPRIGFCPALERRWRKYCRGMNILWCMSLLSSTDCIQNGQRRRTLTCLSYLGTTCLGKCTFELRSSMTAISLQEDRSLNQSGSKNQMFSQSPNFQSLPAHL